MKTSEKIAQLSKMLNQQVYFYTITERFHLSGTCIEIKTEETTAELLVIPKGSGHRNARWIKLEQVTAYDIDI